MRRVVAVRTWHRLEPSATAGRFASPAEQTPFEPQRGRDLGFKPLRQRISDRMADMNRPTTPLRSVDLRKLDWLCGWWHGKIGEDRVEEVWSKPDGGAMMGMFRWLSGDAVRFYELILLEQDGEGVVMRVKHFNAGLLGWEEKDGPIDFALVELNECFAVFCQQATQDPACLVYKLEESSKLSVHFERETAAPPVKDVFRFRRGPEQSGGG